MPKQNLVPGRPSRNSREMSPAMDVLVRTRHRFQTRSKGADSDAVHNAVHRIEKLLCT